MNKYTLKYDCGCEMEYTSDKCDADAYCNEHEIQGYVVIKTENLDEIE